MAVTLLDSNSSPPFTAAGPRYQKAVSKLGKTDVPLVNAVPTNFSVSASPPVRRQCIGLGIAHIPLFVDLVQ